MPSLLLKKPMTIRDWIQSLIHSTTSKAKEQPVTSQDTPLIFNEEIIHEFSPYVRQTTRIAVETLLKMPNVYSELCDFNPDKTHVKVCQGEPKPKLQQEQALLE